MIVKNGNKYESNYARAAAHFLATMAPKPDAPEHKAAYDLIYGIYSAIMEAPEKCGLKPQTDAWFEPCEQQTERQKDLKSIHDAFKKIEVPITELYNFVIGGTAEGDSLILAEGAKKPSKLLLSVLRENGSDFESGKLTFKSGCLKGLSELAATAEKLSENVTDCPKEVKAFLYFSRCVFDPEQNWLAPVFDRAMGADGQVIWLCGELEKRGYRRVVCKEGHTISLDYVKTSGKKDMPVKQAWADKYHYGIELSFKYMKLEPYYIWLRLSAIREVPEKCGKSDSNAAKFIVERIKTCDGCCYCVQTDKTGKRPLAAVPVRDKMKCPYFPAFSFNWRELPRELAENILAALDELYSDEQ